MLVAYAWPGNVRQLKNVAENMSVTSEVRAITSDILQRYLPEERRHNQVVAVAPASGKHSFENEREILYQILFDLRRGVSELKKLSVKTIWPHIRRRMLRLGPMVCRSSEPMVHVLEPTVTKLPFLRLRK